MRSGSNWYEIQETHIVLHLYVQPKASRTEAAGPYGGRLKIRIAAPPVDGEANAELLRFLKKKLKVQGLEIIRGTTGRMKDISCTGIDGARLESLLTNLDSEVKTLRFR